MQPDHSSTLAPSQLTRWSFDRRALPIPQSFYERELGELRKPSRGWASPKAGCPFHASKSKTSFWVHLESGAFCCFGCSVKGGDVLAFARQRYRMGFRQAAEYCGAAQNLSPKAKREIRRVEREREEVASKADSIEQAERDLRLQYRNEIHALERIQREIRERMRNSPADIEECWSVLRLVLPELREAVAAYYLLSYATVGERIDFTLHPEERDRAIQAVINRGTVRDDGGVTVEVDLP